MKPKDKKTLIIVLVAAVVVIVLYKVFQGMKYRAAEKTSGPATVPVSTTSTYTPPASSGLNRDKVLSYGSSGAEVTALQKILNKNRDLYGMAHIGVDGKFGSETEASVEAISGDTSISVNQADAIYQYNKTKAPDSSSTSFVPDSFWWTINPLTFF